ncbi:hypothetical protein BST63_01265 [Bradyrhizobium canariense]|uniref:Integrase catalytic domain-containing protein n=1 Tax=Bradyrhizobium canariense TaxID=255045 RepID=A0ABX3XCD9_9BRAD|nr:integrase core domain-containing protein [Bradyrhizobium canariense]OSJ19088.1 hypothetical protein BSR47_04370 [Bradyrhizobium canariense]OSJ35873.1 hypothetical protein BST63_01265 [Bradyrhizobium canariense]
MQNAFIASFNGRLRDELLSETLFTSLAQHRVALRLGSKTPSDPAPGSGAALCEGSAPTPVATTAQPGKSNSRDEVRLDKLGGKVAARQGTRLCSPAFGAERRCCRFLGSFWLAGTTVPAVRQKTPLADPFKFAEPAPTSLMRQGHHRPALHHRRHQ